MSPRSEYQLHPAALGARQADVVLHRGSRIGVVPARQMHDRHIGITLVETLRVDPRPLPVIVKHAVRPLLEQIVLVFGCGADRRVPFMPGHSAEPGANVLRCQGGFDRRVAGVGERVAVGPGRLLQVECPAMANATAIGVGEAAAIEELCRQPRRVEAAERRLRVGSIGQPEGADTAVAPRLALEPSERVETVLGLAQIFRETAAGMIAAAAILIGDGIAVPDEIGGDLGSRPRLRDCGGALRPARRRFVVGRAFQ